MSINIVFKINIYYYYFQNSPTNSENLESTVSQNSDNLSRSQRTSKRKKEDEALERALSVLDKSDDAAIFGDFVAAAEYEARSP